MRPFFRGKTIIIPATQTQNRLDARGMNRLQRSGTLPTVWIPSAVEVFRARMGFT